MSVISGALYIVATPIGNLEDLSHRAQTVLNAVDIILAEDTRHSRPMLKRYNINTRLQSYHDHNERAKTPRLIKRLLQQQSLALICDAGTPLICDPGYHITVSAHEAGIRVIPIPGPSALTTALSASGFTANQFIFAGYPPAKQIARRQWMQKLANDTRTLVFYETPHRIGACLQDAVRCFGEQRTAALVKELSKYYEHICRDNLGNIANSLNQERVQGEFVIILAGAPETRLDEQEATRILKLLLEKMSFKDAITLACDITKGKKNELYQLAIALKNNPN